ncbi:2OG-Fe(II) oxygenase [Corallococcus sp. H22C18031201]|uniref:2OG-Fe(II) oxygenase n=1 Tax=Citreicoccus inhibens TaxID=2849499 RepID=UPI000E713B8D|nr:2OG-Fe(II) oxygenase [Citreicoccus inhibens]MBU8897096.1 2OG-Fe(II) oxygenase [Citreicoccus inhibens]RJS19715.1 2OG-Fe(II) oxygenase [Corallococcus sp. H22C18031201]
MRDFVTRRNAFSDAERVALRDALLGSRFVARSPLMGTFRASRGFAFIFTHEGRAALEQRFPFLGPYLSRVLDPQSARGLWPWRERWWGARPGRPRPNAYYLNLLLLDAGTEVGRHIDATLQEPSGVPGATPEHVSVLYLQVPEKARGGALHLLRDDRTVGEVKPRPGMLVHFRGDLQHEVRPFTGGTPGEQRASLVCEQYTFPPEALARLPALRIQSKAGFAAYLDAQRERPADARAELQREE